MLWEEQVLDLPWKSVGHVSSPALVEADNVGEGAAGNAVHNVPVGCVAPVALSAWEEMCVASLEACLMEVPTLVLVSMLSSSLKWNSEQMLLCLPSLCCCSSFWSSCLHFQERVLTLPAPQAMRYP